MDNLPEVKELLKVAKKRHEALCREREEIIKKLAPLENQKKLLSEKIEAIERLLELENESIDLNDKPEEPKETIISHSVEDNILSDKAPMEAYKYLAKNYFKNRAFREKNIRELANEKGLLVNGKLITGSYSRAVITRLLEQREFVKVKKGLYRDAESKPILKGFFDIPESKQ